jgi:xylulokinase
MLDINTNVWWKTALDYVGIQEFQMPGIVQTGSVVGTISKKVADTLGIGANTKLIIGGHDQIVAALGAGVAEAGQIMNGLGSVDNMTSVYKKEKKDERFAKFGFCIMPYFLADLYATYSYNLSGGAILRWFRDQLARDLLLPLEQNKLDPYVALNNEVGKIPADLLIMPHFSSTGTPYLDVNSKAIITGLTLNTTRGDLFRAFMEGEAFEMRQNLECLKSLGVEPREIITVGGGARSDVWMQIRADIFDKEVHVLEHKEAGTIGAAILCFLNTGRFTSLKEAFRTMYKGERVFVPYSENVEIYRSKFESYKRLYQMSKEFYGT